jgi:hypothetical protein
MDAVAKVELAQFVESFLLNVTSPGEQVDMLEDAAADLQVRADELREAMRRPPEEGS